MPAADRRPGVDALLSDLRRDGFRGDVVADQGRLPVWSTDGSVYRLSPAAVLFPRDAADVAVACRAASALSLPLVGRGGGTGTNGQSLTDGVVLDFKRHMAEIGRFDAETMTISVGPGVVLDTLNAHLAPNGCFFAPTVSTASRAAVGGMFGTDASGKGSRRYGRTSDHVIGAEIVTADGEIHQIGRHLSASDVRALADGSGRMASVMRALLQDVLPRREEIDRVFPTMNRGLTGYNLKDAIAPDGSVDLVKLLAGSEGTLALTTRLVLKVTRRPRISSVVVLGYEHFREALGDVGRVLEADPLAIEIIDDKILRLARNDPVWGGLGESLGDLGNAASLLFVEFAGEERGEVATAVAALTSMLKVDPGTVSSINVLDEPSSVASVWDLRRQSVGLLGALEGRRRASPFVEDCAVPPANLPAFVDGFRAILDRHGLDYGMFGHADVGCLHVRPTLDLIEPADRLIFRTVSDEVAALAKRHGGLLWGEHGHGVRGEYGPLFFGEELYGVLRRIKSAFDPGNVLNPGKLAVPDGVQGALMTIDGTPFRGEADADIPPAERAFLAKAISCNGNGACHDWDASNAMCPSFKATGDPVQSPKGRATLLREWARLSAIRPLADADRAAAEEALLVSLDTCLSCRACTNRCPVRVDIPAMKSTVLERVHRRRPRSLRDRIIRRSERVTLLARRFPRLANLALAVGAKPLERIAALSDLPRFPRQTFERRMRQLGIPRVDRQQGATHVLLADSFVGVFDVDVLADAAELLRRSGIALAWHPPMANGKALDVRGFGAEHQAVRASMRRQLDDLVDAGLCLVSVEPVATTALREACSAPASVWSLEDLLRNLADRGTLVAGRQSGTFRLLSHCTESTAGRTSAESWLRVFAACGHRLVVERTGCCGMAGLFGHESEHAAMSRRLFDLSWRNKVDGEGEALATGFSCREQSARLAHRLRHPVEALV
jgi:FAD/FMN-containing dehydrogenase/Fe-S oxidoreductase